MQAPRSYESGGSRILLFSINPWLPKPYGGLSKTHIPYAENSYHLNTSQMGPYMNGFEKETKRTKNGSIGWKSLVLAFPLVGNWLAWLVGNGRKIRVGEDPWLGVGERYKISEGLVSKLRSLGIYNLNQAYSTSLQRETLWKSSEQLGLEEGIREEWEEYI